MSACAAAATRRKTTRICFHRTASSERLSMDLFFFFVKALHGRSVGRARVSKRRKSQCNTHIIYWHIGVSRLRRRLKRVPLFFLSLARRVDGWMVSQSFPSRPGRPIWLVAVGATGPVIGGRGGKWETFSGDLGGLWIWVVDTLGKHCGFLSSSGGMDGSWKRREGGYKSVIVFCVRW